MKALDSLAAARTLRAILAGFPEEPFPRDTAISKGGRWFDEAGAPHAYQDPEASEVARFFAGRPWMDISADELLTWDHASVSIIFLTPLAHAYYLPAFLRAFVTAPLDGYAVAVLEHAIRMWTPPDGGLLHTFTADNRTASQKQAMVAARAASFQEFIDALTQGQRSALAMFLEAFEPVFEEPDLDNPVKTALDRFWRRCRRG